MIEAGTVQNGLKLMSVALVCITGDWRSILPTPGDVMAEHHAVLDRLDRRGRDVGHDEALAEVAREGAQPDEVDLELLQPGLGRHVELRDGLRLDRRRSAPRPWRAWKRLTPAST